MISYIKKYSGKQKETRMNYFQNVLLSLTNKNDRNGDNFSPKSNIKLRLQPLANFTSLTLSFLTILKIK